VERGERVCFSECPGTGYKWEAADVRPPNQAQSKPVIFSMVSVGESTVWLSLVPPSTWLDLSYIKAKRCCMCSGPGASGGCLGPAINWLQCCTSARAHGLWGPKLLRHEIVSAPVSFSLSALISAPEGFSACYICLCLCAVPEIASDANVLSNPFFTFLSLNFSTSSLEPSL